jgi:hypothetical protein
LIVAEDQARFLSNASIEYDDVRLYEQLVGSDRQALLQSIQQLSESLCRFRANRALARPHPQSSSASPASAR